MKFLKNRMFKLAAVVIALTVVGFFVFTWTYGCQAGDPPTQEIDVMDVAPNDATDVVPMDSPEVKPTDTELDVVVPDSV